MDSIRKLDKKLYTNAPRNSPAPPRPERRKFYTEKNMIITKIWYKIAFPPKIIRIIQKKVVPL